MPVKIRLARHGRKRRAFYHIVVADSRAPRDGKYIEKIGVYNPTTDPATIELDFDKAVDWMNKGAKPTDTCQAILSYKGVLLKRHLLKGVAKGALTEEQAEEKFNTWKEEKETKIQAKIDRLKNESESVRKKVLEAESKIREKRADELAKKNSELAKALGKEVEPEIEEKPQEKPQEENTEAKQEDKKAEEKAPEKKQEPKEEPKKEDKSEDKKED